MARIFSSAAFLAFGLSVSACGPVTNGLTPLSNPSLSSVNQPVVQRTDYVFDLSGDSARVSTTELARLRGWFDSLQLDYGDSIFIDEAGGYADPAARDAIGRLAADYGILLKDGAPVTPGTVQPGVIRVVVSRSAATVPGCPIYDSQEVGERHSTSPNYGCAYNSNLAAMIADPSDLVLGQRGPGPGAAANISKALKVYRDRIPTGTDKIVGESTGEKK